MRKHLEQAIGAISGGVLETFFGVIGLIVLEETYKETLGRTKPSGRVL